MRRRLHLAQILERLRGDASYYVLQHQIWNAYNDAHGVPRAREGDGRTPPVSRHKLQALIETGSLNITSQELEALVIYLEANKIPFHTVLLVKEEGLIHDLAKRHVVFLVGGRPRGGDHPRHDVSVWDVRAYSHILNQLTDLGYRIQTSIEDVVWAPNQRDQVASRLDEFDKEQRSICAIGSPRSLIASDLLLEKILCGPAGDGDAPAEQAPFQFYWPSDDGGLIGSKFMQPIERLLPGSTRDAVASGKASLLTAPAVNSKEYLLDTRDKPYRDYGLIVARKFQDGRIHLVLAGLSGIGTYVAAQQISEMAFPADQGPQAQIIYALAQSEVTEKSTETQGDPRSAGDAVFAIPPGSWPPQSVPSRR